MAFVDSTRLPPILTRPMTLPDDLPGKSRLAILLDHLATIPDPRDVRRIGHPLAEILLLMV